MGTNYYLKLGEDETCKHCGHTVKAEELHIGKSSGGWVFSLHVMPERNINDLEDWVPLLSHGAIFNEYGDSVSKEELLSIITERSWRGGLARNNIGRYCTKHGDGTWDCIPGEFA